MLVLIISCKPVKCEPDWTYELISIKLDSATPSLIDGDLHITRISRGLFALSGSITLREDLSNDTIIYADIYYSFLGHDYIKGPLRISKTPLPKFMQTFYKDILLDSLMDCSKNTPTLELEGVITKRVLEMENCVISNENMPSHMKNGYYKIMFAFTEQVEAMLEIIAKIEKKD
ncbi:uncharacterized protein LOC135958714 [Calliphora vicina]|uniref:uncharacterized protein LOC135958714 n=1 Tax=Calliphora vicina TaxID=7373 RepID=UPI00325C32D6